MSEARSRDSFRIMSANIDGLFPNEVALSELKADVVCFQAHTLPLASLDIASAMTSKHSMRCKLSPPDPGAQIPAAGVGVCVRAPTDAQAIEILSPLP